MVNVWEIESKNWSRPVPGDMALALIRQLGHAGFAQELLGQVNALADFEHCTVYEFRLDGCTEVSCRVLDAASRRPIPTARETSRLFAQKFAQHDINGRFLTDSHVRRGIFATHFLSRDLTHQDYREVCYTRNALVDRFSLITVEDGRALTINFYKGANRGETAGSEQVNLLCNAPLLLEAAVRHTALMYPSPCHTGADMLARVSALASLTERETQVCCLLLEGLKVPEVALRMGIKASTATTLKKRAFTRMGVRTKEELLRRLAT